MGCHPTSAGEFDDALGAEVSRLATHEKVRAIGETGIDYYRETATRADQRRAFEAQIEIARERELPIVIHARDPDGETTASDEVFEILDARAGGVPVILHCFLAPWRVEDAIERGWYCSFSGIVTYPKSDALREAAAKLPDELLLVETDAPYLAPQPVRGRPNEPAHVVSTAAAVAEVRGVSYEELERIVEANARPSSAGSRVGPARPELPRRSEPARRDRPRRRSLARGRGAGGRGGGGGADRAAGGGRGARPRGRDRSRAGAGPCRRRLPGQRQPALGRRDEARLRRAAPGADGGRRQPSLLGRDAGAAAHDRAAADGPELDGDGAARDRRPAARRARQPHLRLRQRAGAARLRGRAAAQGRPGGVPAAAPGRLGDPAAAPHGPRRRRGHPRAGPRRLRPPPQVARPLAGAARPGGLEEVRAALAALGLPEDARAEALSPEDFVALSAKLR